MTIEMIEAEEFNQGTQIKVIGVGGGGGNAVEHMIAQRAGRGVHLRQHRCAGADAQPAHRTIQLGGSGLGAGSKPDKAATPPRPLWKISALPSKARTCCSSPPAWAAAPAPARRR
jgi:hypothetical protein